MELVKARAFGFTQTFQDGSRIGDCPRDDVAHILLRFVGRERDTAICNELVEVKHGAAPIANV